MCDKGEDSKNEANQLLECEKCEEPWHLQCLDPPLEIVPDGEWHCPHCLALVRNRDQHPTKKAAAAAEAAISTKEKNGSKKRPAEEDDKSSSNGKKAGAATSSKKAKGKGAK